MEFKVGDVVMLKSGGPLMTVISCSGNLENDVSVAYFIDGKFKFNHVPAGALKKETETF